MNFMGEANVLVEMKDIDKSFGPVQVLKRVQLTVYPGEVHILAGENGAGKSTLVKILGGVYRDYGGTIILDGEEIHPLSPLEANRNGIALIHQELSLVPSLSVVDNLFLGRPHTKVGFIHDAAHYTLAKAALERIGLDVDPNAIVEDLPISVQQLIEIAKAIRLNAKVIIMDEPSSALNSQDVETLFTIVDQLKRRKHGLVYITHRMEEITRIADRITVLRDGQFVGSVPAQELPERKLINWMVGREITEQFPRHTATHGAETLRIEQLSVYKRGKETRKLVDKVSLTLRKGEIVGIGGLQGSGAEDLFKALFGIYPKLTFGRLFLNGRPYTPSSPIDSIRNGIALLTNDRKATGLVLTMSVVENMCLANLRELTRYGWRRSKKEVAAAVETGRALQLRAASYRMDVADLSGGNQQKVAIGKWLNTKPSIMLLDEPTRGVDVVAKQEIYRLMDSWTSQGIAILLITSEMPELLAMSDRIIVMHRGVVTSRLSREEATSERVLEAAMGKIETSVSLV
jgi:ribose transport system ATP-binding protein